MTMRTQHQPNAAMKKFLPSAALVLCLLAGCSSSKQDEIIHKFQSECSKYGGVSTYRQGLVSFLGCVFPQGTKPSITNSPEDIQQRTCLEKGGEFFIEASWFIEPSFVSSEIGCRFPDKSNETKEIGK